MHSTRALLGRECERTVPVTFVVWGRVGFFLESQIDCAQYAVNKPVAADYVVPFIAVRVYTCVGSFGRFWINSPEESGFYSARAHPRTASGDHLNQ